MGNVCEVFTVKGLESLKYEDKIITTERAGWPRAEMKQ